MIDILLASYNGSKYIGEQIESIIAQTNKEWKLMIHDDGSVDDTVCIVQEIADAFNSKMLSQGDARRITVSANPVPCGGAAANFIGLLKASESDYVMFCDQDDAWDHDKVEKSMRLMKKLENKYGMSVPLLIYTDLAVTDEHLQMIAPSFIKYMKIPPSIHLPRLLMQNSVTGCTILMNKALCKCLCKVNEPDHIVMHDHFAALTATVLGEVAFLPEATIKYRQHGNNSVGASDARSFSYLWKRYKKGKKQFRKDLYHSMVQAGYFYKLYRNEIRNPHWKKLIYAYSQLYQKPKIYRIRFYLMNHVIKFGAVRALMQFVWG